MLVDSVSSLGLLLSSRNAKCWNELTGAKWDRHAVIHTDIYVVSICICASVCSPVASTFIHCWSILFALTLWLVSFLVILIVIEITRMAWLLAAKRATRQSSSPRFSRSSHSVITFADCFTTRACCKSRSTLARKHGTVYCNAMLCVSVWRMAY